WENEMMVDPAHLQPGHFVARLDRPWLGTPFALEGVMVRQQRQIDWMRQHCDYVIIDFLRSENREKPAGWTGRDHSRDEWEGYLGDDKSAVNVLRRASLDEEAIRESLENHEFMHRQARDLIDKIQSTGALDSKDAREQVRGMADRLETNLAAMVWLTRIKNVDEYTAQHCVNVGVLAMGLAFALEWDRDQIELAGLAGMLHDLGKMKLDKGILSKPGRLTEEEYEHVKKHTRHGFEMVRRDPDVDPRVAQAVLEHHERPDGTGYPLGRKRPELEPMSALISVVDAYDAITSRRPYSEPRSHHEALGILWKQRDQQFDADMVETLIHFLGWVTPGTIVRLTDDRYAVVLIASQKHRLWPVVRVFELEDGKYVSGPRLDLAEHNEAHPDMPLRVRDVLPDGAIEVDLKSLLTSESS
ncbi:MAG: HD-GYP domain-containing protein, partial [Wenzhouxiangellaceae bacterium]|nr:HD-GYP domain-containing protein [Wenzhouxiangellaceae bacterium]